MMYVAALKTEGRGRNPVSTDKEIENCVSYRHAKPVFKIESEISLIDMPWC
jgi:hypothetical protein